jgi:hypothetical protein
MVHGGCREDRPVGREQNRAGKIVGKAQRHFGQKIRGGGGDQHQIALARQADMADFVLGREVEQIVVNAIVR